MVHDNSLSCKWCGSAPPENGRAFCATCERDRIASCLSTAEDVWQRIPWDLDPHRLPAISQYVDTRLMFEAGYGFERAMLKMRRLYVRSDAPLDIGEICVEHAVELVHLYAPNRHVETETRTAAEIIEFHLEPWGQFFLDRVRTYYRESLSEMPGAVPLGNEGSATEVRDAIRADLEDWLPRGPAFGTCLVLGSFAHVAPVRIFKHCLFGHPIVNEPWVVLKDEPEEPRLEESGGLRENRGPYLGRFPPSPWRDEIGLKQCIPNLIRVWTCHNLEALGLSARDAMKLWDDQRFHNCHFSPDRDHGGVTKGFEGNYRRDKEMLKKRLALFGRPFADLPELEQSLADSDDSAKSYVETVPREELVETAQHIEAAIYEPEI